MHCRAKSARIKKAQDKEKQEAAKDLISESITRFEALGETTRAASALSELGFCYRREGRYDDARVIYTNALNKLTANDHLETRAKILIRLVLVESCSGRYIEALRILTDSAQLFEESNNDAPKGKFHNDLATGEPPLPVLLEYARLAGVSADVLIDDKLNLPDKIPATPS